MLVLLSKGAGDNSETKRSFLKLFGPQWNEGQATEALDSFTAESEVRRRLRKFYQIPVIYTNKNHDFREDMNRVFKANYDVDQVPLNLDDLLLAYIETNEFIYDSTRYKIEDSVHIEDLPDKQMLMVSANYFEPKWKVTITIDLSVLSCSLYFPLVLLFAVSIRINSSASVHRGAKQRCVSVDDASTTVATVR